MMKSVKIGDFEIQNRYLEMQLENILEFHLPNPRIYIILDDCLGNYL